MNTSAKLLDFWARAESGETFDETQFTLKIFWRNLKKIAEEYRIDYDDRKIVPSDDQFLNRLFLAGRELLIRTGIYCRNTERIINFEPWEIDESLNFVADSVCFGESLDKVKVRHRGIDPDEPPPVLGRVLGPQSTEIIEKVFLSFAKEPLVDHFHFQGLIEEINGVKVRPNSPFELCQEIKRITYARSALREVGRFGAHDGAMAPAGIVGKIGCISQEWGKRRSDRLSMHILPHMMIDYDQMIVCFESHMHGMICGSSGLGVVNGTAGPPQMVAITIVAQAIACVLLFQSPIVTAGAIDSKYQNETSRQALWAGINAAAAINKNTHLPYVKTVPGSIMTAGLACEEHFWELAAATVGTAVVGCVVQGGTGRKSVEKDYSAGISARFAGEVGRASIGLTREKANELANRFLERYEDKLANGTLHTLGMRFQECYDLEKICPTPKHNQIYEEVKNRASKDGLPL